MKPFFRRCWLCRQPLAGDQLEQLMTQLRARLSRLMDMRRESNERMADLPWRMCLCSGYSMP